jgi:hypothetical protein
LREVARFFSHLFPGIVGLHPSSFHRRIRKLRRFLGSLRRAVLPELVADPETPIVDSALLEVPHPRQVCQSAGLEGAAWVRWGAFSASTGSNCTCCAPPTAFPSPTNPPRPTPRGSS